MEQIQILQQQYKDEKSDLKGSNDKISHSMVMKEKEIQLLLEEGNMEIDTNLDTNEKIDAEFLIHNTDSNQIEKGDSDNDVKMHNLQKNHLCMNNIWLAWSFQTNFMYRLVL
jgi:hypothetical protein